MAACGPRVARLNSFGSQQDFSKQILKTSQR